MNLKEVKVGETVTIKKITGTGPVKISALLAWHLPHLARRIGT